jgi:hypothetical protein
VFGVALHYQLFHAIAEGAGNLHFVAVPGAHLDAPLDVFDVDTALRVQRTRLVNRRLSAG